MAPRSKNVRRRRPLPLIMMIGLCCLLQSAADREAELLTENTQLSSVIFNLEERITRLEQSHAKELQDIKVQYHQDQERLHYKLQHKIQPETLQSPINESILQRLASLETQQVEARVAINGLLEEGTKRPSKTLQQVESKQALNDLEARIRKDIFDDMGSMQLWLQQEYVRATDQVKQEHRRALEEVEARLLETHAKDLQELKNELIDTVNQHADAVAALDGKVDMCYSQHVERLNVTKDSTSVRSETADRSSSLRGVSSPLSYFTPSPTPEQLTANSDAVLLLNETVSKLKDQFQALASSLKCLDQKQSNGADLYFVGCNVHIRNGVDDTLTKNARGNLIIGYNEQTSSCGVGGGIFCKRSGSHNLVLGVANEYTHVGGIISGHHNEISGEFASVFGGTLNAAKGYHANVGGGMQNTARGDYSYTSGGMGNTVTGNFAQILGGSKMGVAKGDFSSVVGGESNNAVAWFGTIIGGQENEAKGQYSLIAGGTRDKTLNYKGATIFGGSDKSAEGEYVTVVGVEK
ncbi:hypothetical protein MPSEU_000099500 [Mayamaea pseudoterrestris]|nr:hypothetical protein MPSEU_000099500 [Mayamaea pseudoterrestris]